MNNKLALPLLPLRGLTVFPNMVMHFDVGRKKSIAAIEAAMLVDERIFLASQKDIDIEDPKKDEIYNVGTICEIKQIIKLPNSESIKVLVEGICRAEISSFEEHEDYFKVEVEELVSDSLDEVEELAYLTELKSAFKAYLRVAKDEGSKAAITAIAENNLTKLVDIIAPLVVVTDEDMQEMLEQNDIEKRTKLLLEIISKEISIMKVQNDIASKVKVGLDESQKEYYLREQIRVIQQELGDSEEEEIRSIEEKIKKLKCTKATKEKMNKELNRLRGLSSSSSEGNTIRNYLAWLLDIPWAKNKKENLNLDKVEECLNKEHYGMDDVKEKILEYLTVRKLNGELKANILCLVGPPGVGKTSIGKSIAESINRDFVRISLGGMKDESEIRGHRRTYVAATPGRFVHALKEAGTMNPVILLDEIDKISTSYKGEPADALLEVLDIEQNKKFRDNYLEIPLDLSKVFFVTTANSLHTIPEALLDRMDIVELSGYTYEEKFNIAKNHLIPKIYNEFNINTDLVKVTDSVISDIIDGYTKESGVRNLERKFKELFRKALRILDKENKETIVINSKNLEKILGSRKFDYDKSSNENRIGVVTGLAWTAYGGDTLPVEAIAMTGSGKLQLTGKLGEVMQESAKAAYTYVRANCDKLKIVDDFYKTKDIHIHVPEGAVPKDGPSAGVTMVTALVSTLTGKEIRGDVAMTGEVTITGRVLPIGGLKEKALAAYRAGIKTIIIPKDNEKDITDIPLSIKKKLNIITVSKVDEVIQNAIIGVCANDN